MFRRREDERPGEDHVRKRAGIVLRIRRDFRNGDMSRRLDELLELPVRDGRPVDPEVVDGHAMNGSLFGIMLVRSHSERAPGMRIMSG